MVPPPKVVPPPRVEDPVTPRRSPQLAALRNYIKDEVDAPARNTRSQTDNRRSTTQEAMLAAVAQRKVAQAQFAQRSFLIEIFSALLYKDTGKLMEYQRLMKNPKY